MALHALSASVEVSPASVFPSRRRSLMDAAKSTRAENTLLFSLPPINHYRLSPVINGIFRDALRSSCGATQRATPKQWRSTSASTSTSQSCLARLAFGSASSNNELLTASAAGLKLKLCVASSLRKHRAGSALHLSRLVGQRVFISLISLVSSKSKPSPCEFGTRRRS